MFKFSAEDIANQTFQTRFRGYDRDQVREFLEGLARQWQEIQQSHQRIEEELEEQNRELREYRRREQSLVKALETARQVADDIRDDATREAEMIIAETELEAEKMLASAEKRVSKLRGELMDLQQQRTRFQVEMRQMLDNYGAMLDRYDTAEGEGEEGHPLPPVPGASDGDEEAAEGEEVAEIDDADIASQHPA